MEQLYVIDNIFILSLQSDLCATLRFGKARDCVVVVRGNLWLLLRSTVTSRLIRLHPFESILNVIRYLVLLSNDKCFIIEPNLDSFRSIRQAAPSLLPVFQKDFPAVDLLIFYLRFVKIYTI